MHIFCIKNVGLKFITTFLWLKNIAVLTRGKQNSGYIHGIIFSSKNAMGQQE